VAQVVLALAVAVAPVDMYTTPHIRSPQIPISRLWSAQVVSDISDDRELMDKTLLSPQALMPLVAVAVAQQVA
jgi:hypothetical protein